jgi:formylmethanofuran dehydrogenase subunit C
MHGGEIRVEGDAGGWVGAEMHGGFIHVHGSAGHLVGAAYRGSRKGMTGGLILIDGDVGNETGHTMRRGTIAVGGAAGDMLGFNMIAGTVLIVGECGIRPGAGMRRGTLCLANPNPPTLLPSFKFGATYRPPMLPLLMRDLKDRKFQFDESLLTADFDLFHGDFVALGKGEVLMRHAA